MPLPAETLRRRAERASIIANAHRTRANIEQIFTDCAVWNDHHPEEEPIDCDPDGQLRMLAASIDKMLADDTGHGPIPPLGGCR